MAFRGSHWLSQALQWTAIVLLVAQQVEGLPVTRHSRLGYAAGEVRQTEGLALRLAVTKGNASSLDASEMHLGAARALTAAKSDRISSEADGDIYPREYAGMADGGSRLPCVDYTVLRSESTRCIDIPSKLKDVIGELCTTVGNMTLLAIYSPGAMRYYFSARVIGPQVMMLPLSYCSVTTRVEAAEKLVGCDTHEPVHVSATYALMSGLLKGDYSLQVLRMYSHFSFGRGKVKLDDTVIMTKVVHIVVSQPYGLQVLLQGLSPLNILSQSASQSYSQRATWPICSAPFVYGSWVTSMDTSSHSLPPQLAKAHDMAVAHWQPLGCNFLPIHKLNLASCMERHKCHVCFIGDSQTRHMYNGFVTALHNYPVNPIGSVTDKEVLQSASVSYTNVLFGDSKWLRSDLDVCTHVFFNFGQHPLSYLPPSRWSTSHYMHVMHQLLLDVKAYKRSHPGTKFFWTATAPHGIGSKFKDCAKDLDYRSHPYTEMFNAVASKMMHLNGIDQVNTFDVTQPFFDLNYDNAHYHWNGTVGHYLTEYLSNVVCAHSTGSGAKKSPLSWVLGLLSTPWQKTYGSR